MNFYYNSWLLFGLIALPINDHSLKSLQLCDKINFSPFMNSVFYFHVECNDKRRLTTTQIEYLGVQRPLWLCNAFLRILILLADSLSSVVSHLQLYSPPVEFHHIVKLQLQHMTHWCVRGCRLSMFSLMNLPLQFLILTAHADHYLSLPHRFRIINLTFFLGRVLIFNWKNLLKC